MKRDLPLKTIFFFAALFVFLPAHFSPAQGAVPGFNPHYVALTFDDGPWPEPTRDLLAVLSKSKAKATFFIVGKVGNKHKDVLLDIHESGHELANHTWRHRRLMGMDHGELVNELERTRRLIHKITGKSTRLFRTPGSTMRYLTKRFHVPSTYQLALWSRHSLDHEGKSEREIYRFLTEDLRHGDVVLLHNGVENTTRALEKALPQLQKRGFQFVTMSELMGLYEANGLEIPPSVLRKG